MAACRTCGCDAGGPVKGRPRSVEQLRRYFALIRSAYDSWPESHDVQFSSAEECRAWLQMKAGYREVTAQIPLAGMRRDRALLMVEAAIRASGSYAYPVIRGDAIVIFRPKSIAFGSMGPADFSRLNDAVTDVVALETGLDAGSLLREGQAA